MKKLISLILAFLMLSALSVSAHAVTILTGDTSTAVEEESPYAKKITVTPLDEFVCLQIGKTYRIQLGVEAQPGYRNKTIQVNVYTNEGEDGEEELMEIDRSYMTDPDDCVLVITPVTAGETVVYIETVDPSSGYYYDFSCFEVEIIDPEDSPFWHLATFEAETDFVEFPAGERYVLDYEIEYSEDCDPDSIGVACFDIDDELIGIEIDEQAGAIIITSVAPCETSFNVELYDYDSGLSYDIVSINVTVTEEIWQKLWLNIDTDDIYLSENSGVWVPFEILAEDGWENSEYAIGLWTENGAIAYADFVEWDGEMYVNIEYVSAGETEVYIDLSDPDTGEYYDSLTIRVVCERMTFFDRIAAFFRNFFQLLFGWLSF